MNSNSSVKLTRSNLFRTLSLNVYFNFNQLVAYSGDSSVADYRASDRKVVSRGFDFRTGNASLCPRERCFTLISQLGQTVYQLW